MVRQGARTRANGVFVWWGGSMYGKGGPYMVPCKETD